jgi:hypothetical protein
MVRKLRLHSFIVEIVLTFAVRKVESQKPEDRRIDKKLINR